MYLITYHGEKLPVFVLLCLRHGAYERWLYAW